MRITINGQSKIISAPDIATLLKDEGYAGKTVAVARNGTFVRREDWANTPLNDNDDIEIVAPMQGG